MILDKLPSQSNRYIVFCKILLIVLSFVYLCVEVLFNMSLLEAISSPEISAKLMHDIEIFGRRASSSGFTLFVIGLFLSTGFVLIRIRQWVLLLALAFLCAAPFILTEYHPETLIYVLTGFFTVLGSHVFLFFKPHPKKVSVVTIFGLAIMSWPSFYNGKIAITEKYIVDKSSGQDRLAAKYVSLLRSAIALDVVQLEDVAPLDLGGIDKPEAKAFLVMLGPLSLNSESLLAWAEDQSNRKGLIRSISSNKKILNKEEEYEKYKKERERFIEEVYRPYSKRSEEFVERNKSIKEEAEKAWGNLQSEISRFYEKYKNGNNRFIRSYRNLAKKHVSHRLKDFFKRRANCKYKRCRERRDHRYQKMMSRLISPPPPWTIFCNKKESHTGAKVLKAVFTLGSSLLKDNYECYTDPKNVGLRLAFYKQKEFINRSENVANLPLGLRYKKFLRHPNFIKYLRAEIKREHFIELPESWRPGNVRTFYKKFVPKAEKLAKKKWRRGSHKAFNAYVKPGLSLNELANHPAVRKEILEKIGVENIDHFSFSWSKREFEDNIILPKVDQKVKREVASFRNDSEKFKDGGDKEVKGKNYFRSAMIPPIAVALSLLFSFLSASKLLLSTLSLATYSFTGKKKKMILGACWAVSVLTILSMPFLATNQYAESEAWRTLRKEASKESYAITTMSEYVIRVEPLLARNGGNYLIKTFNPYSLIK